MPRLGQSQRRGRPTEEGSRRPVRSSAALEKASGGCSVLLDAPSPFPAPLLTTLPCTSLPPKRTRGSARCSPRPGLFSFFSGASQGGDSHLGRLPSALAVFALASWTHGLLLQIPVDWASSSQVNITWSNDASDQVFALQLFNTDEFHDTFSIANNLQPSADFASFQLGVIPQGCVPFRPSFILPRPYIGRI